nr:BREX protein BrxB domain-containing protein [Halomicrobium katesii]
MEQPEIPDEVTVQPIWLDELLPQTDVYKLLVDLGEPLVDLEGDASAGERIEETMQDQLAEELVQQMIEHELSEDQLETQSHVVLLLNLGSLYPFTRASELLDELDRRNVKSTIGIPFPGDVVGGKLSFFGGESRHYYPAHQIDGQIQGVHLQ